MSPELATKLAEKEISSSHGKLLEKVKNLVRLSRSSMGDYYDTWDQRDSVYRAEVTGTKKEHKENKKEQAKGGVGKIVVPLTYSQIQTFVSMGFSLFFQRDHFYELEGTGEEDHKAAKIGEALLDRDLTYNVWSQKMYQMLLDVARFGIAPIKHTWTKETETVWKREQVPVEQPLNLFGRLFGGEPQTEERDVKQQQTRFLGNKILNVSPYRFFPDTRLPLSRFQEGEFCASEDEISRTMLLKGQAEGEYAGIEHINDFKNDEYIKRGQSRHRSYRDGARNDATIRTGQAQTERAIIVTEVQIDLVPAEWEIDGVALGDSTTPEKWVVCYANDNRIIKIEPLAYTHGNFTYRLAQFSPDQHHLVNETIASMIDQLQAVIDWFINSHITNVRKHIGNRLVVDPAGVEWSDIQQHKPVIRLKPDASKTGVDRWVKQLNVSDVTKNHINDVSSLMRFMQTTTAISDQLMGQPSGGRRSAREMGNTFQAGMARMRMVYKLIYDECLSPFGRDLNSNHRDGLDEETFVTVSGDLDPDWTGFQAYKKDDGLVSIGVDRTNISARYDFKVFEGTLPSERNQQADTLEQILLSLIKSPQGLPILTQVLGYDPQKLFEEVLTLRGIKHPSRFKLDAIRQQEIQQDPQVQQQLQPNGQPTNPNGGPSAGGFSGLLGGAGQQPT